MSGLNLKQIMCSHKMRRNERAQTYDCRCGLRITDRDLAEAPKDLHREITVWMAYHFDDCGTRDP